MKIYILLCNFLFLISNLSMADYFLNGKYYKEKVFSERMRKQVKEIKVNRRDAKSITSKSKINCLDRYPNSFSLKKYDTSVKKQKGGTCTAHALIAAVENIIQQNQEVTNIDLSEKHLWSLYRRPTLDVAIPTFWSNFVTREDDYNSKSKNNYGFVTIARNHNSSWSSCKYPLGCPKYLDSNGEDEGNNSFACKIIDVIFNKKRPVVMAMDTPQDMADHKEIVTKKGGKKSGKGEHVLSIVGYEINSSAEGGGYYIMKNSWGTSNGNGGYHKVEFGYCSDPKDDILCWPYDVKKVWPEKINEEIMQPTYTKYKDSKGNNHYKFYTKIDSSSLKTIHGQKLYIENVQYKLFPSTIKKKARKDPSNHYLFQVKSNRVYDYIDIEVNLINGDKVIRKIDNIVPK